MRTNGMLKRCVGVLAAIAVVLVVLATSRSTTRVVEAAGTGYVSLAPARILDTRSNGSTVDSQFRGLGERPANSTLQLLVTGRATVPIDATSVVVNVTVAETKGAGYITVFPCDAGQPTASNLNYVANQNIPNLVISKIGAGGVVCLFNSAPTQIIVDVAGYFPGVDAFTPLASPVRLLDTRPGQPTIDGAYAGQGARAAGSLQMLQVSSRAGIPPGIAAVVLNVTVDQPQSAGYVTVHPCDTGTPNASNLNYLANQAVPNAVVSKLSTTGTVCLFTSKVTHLIVDVAGYFADTTVLVPLPTPARLLDTRPSGATVDNSFQRTGLRPSGGTIQLTIGSRVSIPADASAAVLNVTVDQTQTSGFITVYPTGVGQPNASSLNYVANQAVPNAVIARIGSNGTICLFNSGATHLIVDVVGYITGPAPVAGSSCPPDPVAPPPPPPPTTPTTPPTNPPGPPANPGNSKDCGDFATHAEAQAWFLTYYPYYGDVANLDADDDGIACEALP